MADSAVDLVNAALVRIGDNPITSGELASPPDDLRAAVVAELLYGPTRDEEQRVHAWVFTLVRDTLLAYTLPAATLTPAATTGTGINFTASAAVFVAGDVGKTLENQAGTGVALITGFTSTTVVVATITEAFPNTSAIASGSWRLYYAAPDFSFARKIPVPSGMLRLLRVRHQVPYRLEGTYILTDSDSLDVVYIARITDTTLFDPLFDEVLAARLAVKFCYAITGKLDRLQAASAEYDLAVKRAKEAFALEQGEGEWEEDDSDRTQARIIQDALARLVAQPTQGPLDPIDLTATANRLYPNALAELQRMHPFRFTRVRTKLDATTTMVLRPGDDAATVDSTGVTFTASSAFFAATDVGARLLADAGGIARITAYTSTTVVTATIETAVEDFLAEPEASVTPAATTGTGITFTASASVFTAADVGKTIENTTGVGIGVITAQAGTTATVTITEDFPSTAALAEGAWQLRGIEAAAWHIAPPWKWTYRYAKPTGFLRLLETQCFNDFGAEPITWGWREGWRWPIGLDQPTEEPAVLEGIYLVSDAGPTLDIEYVQLVTDPALFEDGFASVLAAFLAWRMALPVTKSAQIEQVMAQAFGAQLKAVRTADKHDTRVPPRRGAPLTAVRF